MKNIVRENRKQMAYITELARTSWDAVDLVEWMSLMFENAAREKGFRHRDTSIVLNALADSNLDLTAEEVMTFNQILVQLEEAMMYGETQHDFAGRKHYRGVDKNRGR